MDINHRRSISIPKDKIYRKIAHKIILSSINGIMGLKEVRKAVSIIYHNMKNYDKNRNNSKLLNLCNNKSINSRENNSKIPMNSDPHSCRKREKVRDKIFNHNIAHENFIRKINCRKKLTAFYLDQN